MTATPETKMKTKAERKQAAWDAYEKTYSAAWAKYQKIRDDASWDEYKKIIVPALDAYETKVKEIDDE